MIIKKVDEENFKANYQRYKKRLEELEESPQKVESGAVKAEVSGVKV